MRVKVSLFMTLLSCGCVATLCHAADGLPADMDFIREAETSSNQEVLGARAAIATPAATPEPPNTTGLYSDHGWALREIQAQRKALALYGQEAANGDDTALQEFARRQLRIVRLRLKSLRLLRTS